MALNNFIHPKDYEGDQYIVLSDRLVLNARKDDIFILSKNSVTIGSNEFHVNTDGKTIINSSEIQLGLKNTEPLLLGDKTETVINSILTILQDIASSLSTTVATPPGTPIPNLTLLGSQISTKLVNVKKQLTLIKSKYNKTR